MNVLDESFKSERPQTIWGNVSLDTVKATRIWKLNQGADGKVDHKIFNRIIKAALVELGYDEKAGINYKKYKHQNIRSSYSNEVIFQTIVYSFPVRKDFPYKTIYEKLDIVHFNEDNSKDSNYTSLYNFGLEEYSSAPAKDTQED